jgi:hypothetical protein
MKDNKTSTPDAEDTPDVESTPEAEVTPDLESAPIDLTKKEFCETAEIVIGILVAFVTIIQIGLRAFFSFWLGMS